MNIGEIVKNSIVYPLSDWKKLLILGILIVVDTLNYIFHSLGMGVILSSLGSVGLVFGVLVYGYEIRVLKSSLAGFSELPQFNDWLDIIINGIKVILVGIAYAIPLILIIVFGELFLGLTLGNLGATNFSIFLEILVIIVLLYLIIIFPIFLMSLANMAFYDSELDAAFKFREIFNKISSIGWGNFAIWYVVTGIICLIVIFVGAFVEVIFNLISLKIIGVVLVPLVLLPYMFIYVFRSSALFYLSESQGYLICEKCGGYYKLQPGESAKDFEKCQCGGDLKYAKQIVKPLNVKSGDSLNDKRSFRENLKFFNKKWILLIIGLLAFIVVGLSFIPAQHTVITNSTLIGTYNVSEFDPIYGTVVTMPQGTTKIRIDYNLSWAPVSKGAHGLLVVGYNTNVTGGSSLNDFNGNIIVNKGIPLLNENQSKTGSLNLDGSTIKSIVLSEGGVKGTVKIYSIKTKLTT